MSKSAGQGGLNVGTSVKGEIAATYTSNLI